MNGVVFAMTQIASSTHRKHLGLKGRYITMVNYGMIDSMIGLILCGGLPVFNLILIINFFRSLPDSLEEAAVVDGAGPWRILFSIVVPCSVPVLATIILFTGVGYWNEFFQGMVLSSSDSSYPLQAYIQQMVVTTQIDEQQIAQRGQGIHRHGTHDVRVSLPAALFRDWRTTGRGQGLTNRQTSTKGLIPCSRRWKAASSTALTTSR